MLAGEQDLALIVERGGARDAARVQEAGRARAVLVQAREKRPFPWESPPDPIEVAHEVFQAWLTFAIFDNARRGHLGTDLDDVPRRPRRA